MARCHQIAAFPKLATFAVAILVSTCVSSLTAEGPTSEQIDHWIESLGHDTYAVRQDAAKRLLAAGPTARTALVAAAESPDPEARAAARRLVAQIDRLEFEHRLAAFAADTNGRQGLTLPGWEQFQKLVGSDSAARALFVEMQRSEAPLLASVFAAESGPQKPDWESRLLRLMKWPSLPGGGQAAPTLGSCATMIFLGSVPEGQITDRGAAYVQRLIQMPPILQPVRKATRDDAVRRLVVAWVMECPNKSAAILQQRLYLATALELSEAVPLALGVALNDPPRIAADPMLRVVALTVVAQLGGMAEAEKLEPLLADDTVCRQNVGAPGGPAAVGRQVQIRDVALVAMLFLTNQDPAQYGYVHARRQAQQLMDLGSLFIETDDQRIAAIAKWRDWKAQQNRDAATEKPVN